MKQYPRLIHDIWPQYDVKIESTLSTKWSNIESQALNNAADHTQRSTDIIHVRYSFLDDPTNGGT